MNRELMQSFFAMLAELDGKDYIMSTVAFGAAPTIKSIKPSALFSFSRSSTRNLYELWEQHKQEICDCFGLCFCELKRTGDQLLVLLYNKELLERLIRESGISSFLQVMGYDRDMTLEESLELLKLRFDGLCPHEIGVFLGIPLEDVIGFIENKGAGCLRCRYWKVYCNPERADRLFRAYDMAKMSIMKSIFSARRKAGAMEYGWLKRSDIPFEQASGGVLQ